MAGLFSIEQPANLLQRSVGSEPARLVEQDDAADVATYTLDLGHAYSPRSSLCLRSSATARSISELSSTPRRMLAS